MDASSTGVDPDDVLKSKVLPQRTLTDLDGAGHVLPALLADGGTLRGTDTFCARSLSPTRRDDSVMETTRVDGVRARLKRLSTPRRRPGSTSGRRRSPTGQCRRPTPSIRAGSSSRSNDLWGHN